MDAAEILFAKLTLEYVETELLGREFENNVLECKEKAHPEKGQTDQQDETHFGKALSGFANTCGGVLVFGLRARKNGDVDEIQSIEPISELKAFESRLREIESRIVERPVAAIDYRPIETEPGRGMLAVHIPESNWLPHRSTKDSKFYVRAGGTFQPIDVPLVEDLFFRRRLRPKLGLRISVQNQSNVFVYLTNDGEATATNPYLVLTIPDGIARPQHEVDNMTSLQSFVLLGEYQGKRGPYWAYQRGGQVAVHPHSEVPVLRLKRERHGGDPMRFTFEYHIYADNMAPNVGECTVDA